MGKKNRKTRWRTLAISGGHQQEQIISDSDDSTTNEHQGPFLSSRYSSTITTATTKNYHQQQHHQHHNNLHHHHHNHQQHHNNHHQNQNYYDKNYHSNNQNNQKPNSSSTSSYYSNHNNNRYVNSSSSYSSQSTPIRRYHQNNFDGTKSTRSSSTASENKITFNEDEYTRITTPRQDVLFKKGYLNKPKNYQTQTSTGTSTTSTGNSTGNGTPDHQSTDLEYESQFVFPNGFVDQNGIYYVNSFEPYPLMLYNPPTYYPEFTNVRSKRCSTGSLTDSTSPHNEEVGQDSGQSDLSNGYFNVVYSGFYFNNTSTTTPVNPTANMEVTPNTAPSTADEGALTTTTPPPSSSSSSLSPPPPQSNSPKKKKRRKSSSADDDITKQSTDNDDDADDSDDVFSEETKQLMIEQVNDELPSPPPPPPPENSGAAAETSASPTIEAQQLLLKSIEREEEQNQQKYDLKPDAEEFVPRAYRLPETPTQILENNVQFIKFPTNFVPVPIINPASSTGETAFLPATFPINFIPHPVNFVPNFQMEKIEPEDNNLHALPPVPQQQQQQQQTPQQDVVKNPKAQIDIARIVSKLEEAAKEQEEAEVKKNEIETKPIEEKIQPEQSAPPPSPIPPKKIQNRFRKPRKFDEDKRNRNPIWKSAQITTPSSPKRESSQTPVKNYSETVKRSTSFTPRFGGVQNRKLDKSPPQLAAAPPSSPKKEEVKTEKPANNQWISVSNRKKRKNRNVEEVNEFEMIENEENDSHEFECYDVTLLEDVVIANESETKTIEQQTPIPNEEIAQNTTKHEEQEEIVTKPPQKKKSQKKPPLKRVIVRDIVEIDEIKEKTETVDTVTSIPPPLPPPLPPSPPPPPPVIESPPPSTIEPIEEPIKIPVTETPEKKTGKKKKKKTKNGIISSESSSSILNLNVIPEDSYDFLLETSLLDDSSDKTNVEISQELDKMIQRGIYSNLEEKIKSLNITPESTSDGFFETVMNNFGRTSRESSVEKNSYIKTPDFSKIVLKSSQVTRSFTTPMTIPEKSNRGDFLGLTPPDLLGGSSNGDETNEPPEPEKLYPITQAVKEWMTKTRETTPEIEILKSPSTILKEFGANSASLEEDDGCDEDEVVVIETQKNDITSPLVSSRKSSEGGEEITIYTREGSIDLLEYWDDSDVKSSSQNKLDHTAKESRETSPIEIYESNYGKNEDYLRIKAEIEELNKEKLGSGDNNSGDTTAVFPHPKHGNLPYRAICCSIM